MAVAGDELHDHHHHHELDHHHQVEEAPLGRRLGAEFVGTLLFVAVGTGAATVLAIGPLQRLGGLTEILQGAPGQDKVFGALLANTLGDVLPVALAFAFALSVLVYAFGGVSGAHFNPAVTFALAVARRFRWNELPLYWLAQIGGAIAGAFVVAGIYGQNGAALNGADILFGATVVSPDVTRWQAILAEAFIAFILMTAIMAVAIDHRAPKGWSGLIIGLGLAGGIMVTAQATGGSANFARSLGPFVASLVYDVDNIPWSDLIVFATGPLIGAAAAALVYESLTGLERAAPSPEPGASTHDEGRHDHSGSGRGAGTAGGKASWLPPGLARKDREVPPVEPAAAGHDNAAPESDVGTEPAGADATGTGDAESGVPPGLAPTGDDATETGDAESGVPPGLAPTGDDATETGDAESGVPPGLAPTGDDPEPPSDAPKT